MLTKIITYTDFNDEERTETFYFNLSKAELIELDAVASDGLGGMMKRMIDAKDGKIIVETIKDIILRSYGEKTMNGNKFVKSPEISAAFATTEAYSSLFMELISDPEAAAAFMTGIIPRDLRNEVGNDFNIPKIVPQVPTIIN